MRGQPGAITGTLNRVPNPYMGAVSGAPMAKFGSNTSYASFPGWTVATPFSIIVLFVPTSFAAIQILTANWDGTNFVGTRFSVNTSGQLQYSRPGASDNAYTTLTPTLSGLNKMAFTLDGTNAIGYLEAPGFLFKSESKVLAGATGTPTAVTISNAAFSQGFVNGFIEEVLWFNRVLTVPEIHAFFDAPYNWLGNSPLPKALMKPAAPASSGGHAGGGGQGQQRRGSALPGWGRLGSIAGWRSRKRRGVMS